MNKRLKVVAFLQSKETIKSIFTGNPVGDAE